MILNRTKEEAMRKLAIIGAVALLVIALAVPAQAKFPAKDIILLCPWSAGGGTDTISGHWSGMRKSISGSM